MLCNLECKLRVYLIPYISRPWCLIKGVKHSIEFPVSKSRLILEGGFYWGNMVSAQDKLFWFNKCVGQPLMLCLLELCNTINTTWCHDTKWLSHCSKLWYRRYWLCNIAKQSTILGHIFDWFGSNLLHRIPISVHYYHLNNIMKKAKL